MDLFITTFESVAVLLGIGIIGFYIIKKGILTGKILSVLSPLALEIALPSLIFVRIVLNFTTEKYPDWWHLPLWWAFFTIVAFGLTIIFMFLSKKKFRREFAITLFFQNAIFFPLAILASIFPDDPSYVLYLFLFTIFYAPFIFSTYFLFFKPKEKIKINWKRIIHPVLIATIIALIITSFGITLTEENIIIRIFSLIGGMTIPLLFIILGGNIYNDFKQKGKIYIFEVVKFVIIKNFIFPLIFLVILFYLKDFISANISIILIIQGAVPPITAVPILTARVGGNRNIVNQFIVGSFAVSLISIPLIMYIFNQIFNYNF
ncbi:MAG: AEC family transporter [Candidatus Thermoplasmatota archaeon]|nr:AEC family transporter [Candidatus Thermoplasmatota archaeon]